MNKRNTLLRTIVNQKQHVQETNVTRSISWRETKLKREINSDEDEVEHVDIVHEIIVQVISSDDQVGISHLVGRPMA